MIIIQKLQEPSRKYQMTFRINIFFLRIPKIFNYHIFYNFAFYIKHQMFLLASQNQNFLFFYCFLSAVDFISFILLLLNNFILTTSIQSYKMPKYVLKEDVQKGLVDPTKSLDQQPQYKQKIEKQAQEKQKGQQEKKPQYNRPKKERPPRNARPKFNWNKQEITEQTKIPQPPKKILEKPNKQKHNEGLQKFKAERQALKVQRKKLIDEQWNIIKSINQSKKTGKLAINQYSGQMREKFNTQSQLRKQIKGLDDVKKRVNADIQILQSRYDQLKKPSNSESYSLEDLQRRISYKQQNLTTKNLDKKQQARLNNEIMQLKRALHKARPSIQIESQIGKLKDQIDILYKELKAIKKELHIKITQANSIKGQLDVIKEQKKSQQGAVSQQKSVDDIKKEYEQKIKAVDLRRDKLEDKIDDYIDKFTRTVDDYEDQQDLLKYNAWIEDQVNYLKKKKQDQEKRKKQRQEYEKRKLKQKQQYQKRKQQRKKAEQERKTKEQQRKIKLQKQRQAYINRNPNHAQINLCENLISYCQSLRPVSFKVEQKQAKPVGQIKFGKQWQKQLKGGAQVIQSKKSKADQQIPNKKPVKQKKEQKPEDQQFTHGIEVINQFQKIKQLPPNNVNEIDASIKLIQDKIAFYNNPTQQQVEIFRQKAAKQFDERNGLRESKGHYKQKQEHEQKVEKVQKSKKREKKDFSQQDFPGLN